LFWSAEARLVGFVRERVNCAAVNHGSATNETPEGNRIVSATANERERGVAMRTSASPI